MNDRQCPSCGGFCKKSGCELSNVLPETLGREMKWTAINEPPKMLASKYGWPMSDPVLGFSKYGRMQVVTYEQVDDDCVPEWKTACSERWNVTNELTHWMNLPQPPNANVTGLAPKKGD